MAWRWPDWMVPEDWRSVWSASGLPALFRWTTVRRREKRKQASALQTLREPRAAQHTTEDQPPCSAKTRTCLALLGELFQILCQRTVSAVGIEIAVPTGPIRRQRS